MTLRKTRKKFGGIDIIGDIKGAVGTIFHPETALKHLIDRTIHQKLVDWAKKQIDPNDTNPDSAAIKLADDMFAKNKVKINEGVDKLYKKVAFQGYITVDEVRHAVVELIPIPEVPEVVDDIIDIFEEVGLTAGEGVTTVELLNNIRKATTGLNSQVGDPELLTSATSAIATVKSAATKSKKTKTTKAKKTIKKKKGGRRNRRRVTKKYLIASRKSRRR